MEVIVNSTSWFSNFSSGVPGSLYAVNRHHTPFGISLTLRFSKVDYLFSLLSNGAAATLLSRDVCCILRIAQSAAFLAVGSRKNCIHGNFSVLIYVEIVLYIGYAKFHFFSFDALHSVFQIYRFFSFLMVDRLCADNSPGTTTQSAD